MQHDYDVRSSREGETVTGLLIAPVAFVERMPFDHKMQCLSNFHGSIAARIIHKNDLIDTLTWNLSNGLFQRSFCLICRQHDYDLRRFFHLLYIRESSIKQKQQSDCVDVLARRSATGFVGFAPQPLACKPTAKIVPCGNIGSVSVPELLGQNTKASRFQRFLHYSQHGHPDPKAGNF
jgi:hypothetical protein